MAAADFYGAKLILMPAGAPCKAPYERISLWLQDGVEINGFIVGYSEAARAEAQKAAEEANHRRVSLWVQATRALGCLAVWS
eukprot:s17_g36.t1